MRIIFLALSIIAIVGHSDSCKKDHIDRNNHQSIIDDFGEQLERDLEDDNIIGSISATFVKGNKIILSKAYGTSDPDKDTKANSSTIYRTGSISKSFTAFLMMQLVEEGVIKIHEPIEKYLPEIRGLKGYSDSTK